MGMKLGDSGGMRVVVAWGALVVGEAVDAWRDGWWRWFLTE